jgi:DNA-binding NtrC family response regulator
VLRALQERAFERLGGNATIQVDVRVVAATNRDLRAAVAGRQFREDLFFRLEVFPVHIPPLRDRASDVPLIARFVLQRTAAELNKPIPELSADARAALSEYSWPGNVRELENCLERALILSDGATIEARHLNLPVRPMAAGPLVSPAADPWESIDLTGTLDEASRRVVREVERRKIAEALRAANGDTVKAAERLGMPSRLLTRKIRSYGVMAASQAS